MHDRVYTQRSLVTGIAPTHTLTDVRNHTRLSLYVAPRAQLVAHLAHLVVGQSEDVTTVPMECSAPVQGPVINGEEQPCVQAAMFHSSARTTYAVLNVCNASLTVDVAVGSPGTTLDTTTCVRLSLFVV